jgi:hypothetical protein
MKLTPPPEAAGPAEAAPEGTIPLVPEAAQAVPAEQPPPMGSADGEVNQETGTPILGQEPVAEPVQEQIPAAVEEASLAHQAALAAAGEVHVEVNEGEMVEFSAQGEINAPMAPAQPSMAPPEWSPAPLSDYGAAQPPANQEMVWIPTSASRIDSLMRGSPGRSIEEEQSRRRTIIWAVGATGVVGLIIGLLWLLRGQAPVVTWEQQNRDAILTLKDEAEQLAVDGDNQRAYEKYQELERMVSGQTITDQYLQQELARSWVRKDSLYDLLTAAKRAQAAKEAAATMLSPGSPGAAASAHPPTPPPGQVSPASEPSESQNFLLLPPLPLPATPPPEQAPPKPRVAVNKHPAVKPDPVPQTGLTDAQVGDSIQKGVDFLLEKFSGPEIAGQYEHYEGLDTLAVYALMQAGLATHDKRLDIHNPFMVDAIEAMKKFPMVTDYVTYARALRATALALYDRPQDHAAIREDVDWLLQSQEGGAFTYNNEFPRGGGFSFWDNSNTQYGLLGVWSGAEVGIQIPMDFWRDVREHWNKYQLPDGEWCYREDQTDPSRSMTLAGIASLLVAQDYLESADYAEQVGRPPYSPALAKALQWLATEDNSVIALPHTADFYTYYSLYGLERTGLASGYKYYGAHDWYRERAADIIAAQKDDGSWGNLGDAFDTVVDTAFSMLFLARGRHPVLMNKLNYDGDWANRPRDVANLARFASAELERPLNWQIVPLNQAWTDSPILYLSGDKPPKLNEQDKWNIKQYILNGGMLLTQADADSEEFSAFVRQLGRELFPQYQWQDLPDDSVVFSVSYHISDHPKIEAITNGSRILMMHWPDDVSKYWQLRQDRIHRPAFELGVNLALYAAGKSDLKNRVESEEIEMPPDEPLASMKIARVKYRGNWDPEPNAWDRGRRWLRQQTSLDIDPEATEAGDLSASKAPLADLIGTGKLNLTDKQIASMKKYVESGGILLVEPCGQPDAFLQSFHDDVLLRMFPDANAEPVSDSSPLMTASGNGMSDVSNPDVRQFVRSYTDITDWRPMMAKQGQGRILILPVDMTSGLLGADAWGIAGYEPEYALQLMKNIVLWGWDGGGD